MKNYKIVIAVSSIFMSISDPLYVVYIYPTSNCKSFIGIKVYKDKSIHKVIYPGLFSESHRYKEINLMQLFKLLNGDEVVMSMSELIYE